MKKQKFWTTIGTKFAPRYTCTSTDAVETKFLTNQYLKPFLLFRHFDGIFFTRLTKNSVSFLMNLLTSPLI